MKFYNYLEKHDIGCCTYWDYINACQYLGLDIEQNKYPKDFNRAHDLRIAEYDKAKLLADKKQRKELYENFKQVASKYLSLQRNLNEDYVVVIAKSPGELIKEGKALDHCVGRMNYDQKFAREESLIFFIRNKEEIDKPFVTMEYSLKTNKILQCYAKHNKKPEIEVQDFVNKKWLPYANRKLKKLVA